MRWALFAVAMSGIGVGSVNAEPTVTLKSDPFNEVLRESAEVSGIVVAGVQRHGSGDLSGVSLMADLPAGWAGGSVCVHVLSSDGLYEAESSYMLAEGWEGGQAQLGFPTTYTTMLETKTPGELAVRVSSGDCATPDQMMTIANWNDAQGRSPLSVLLNSFRADEVFAYLNDSAEAITCTRIESAGLTAFDQICELPAELRGPVTLMLYRIKNGKPARPTKVKLWAGAQP